MPSAWNTAEIGYFEPDNSDQKHVVTKEGIRYFRNVYAFVGYLRNLTTFISPEVIRDNLHFCLRNEALSWFATELDPFDRVVIRNPDLEVGWFKVLIKRFRPETALALHHWNKYFDWEDGPDEVVEWAQNMTRHAQAIGDIDQKELVMNIWEKAAVDELPKPTWDMSLSDFMKILSDWRTFKLMDYDSISVTDEYAKWKNLMLEGNHEQRDACRN